MLVTTKLAIVSLSISLALFFTISIFSAYGDTNLSYLDQVNQHYDNYNNSLWSLGENIQEGDYYSYKICNDDYIAQKIYPYHCYNIELEFVTILESYKGKVWIVQGNFTTLEINRSMIFLIDPDTFEVDTDLLNVDLGNSLENTIFLLSIYGEKSLSIGTVWDHIDSYFTNKIPLEIKNKQTIQIPNGVVDTSIETSVLSYDIIIPSNIYLHNDFPFPLKAKLYSPNIIYPEPQELYYFELLEYSKEFGKSLSIGTLKEDFPIP